MFYADLKHNTKDKIKSNGKKAPTSTNGFFYITRTAHFRNGKEGEEVEWVKSGNMPNYAKDDPKQFWVNADRFEQKNGRTSSVLTIALPNNISKSQRIELVQKFIDEFANKNGFAFTCAIHNHKSSIEGKDQPHLHFMYSERPTLNNEDMHPKQFFARYNAKNPSRGGVRKLSADALGFGKNHVDHIRKTTETLINDYLSEHAPTKKIMLKGIEIEVPSLVSSLSNRAYNKIHGTKLKDVEQLQRWQVQSKDPKHQAEIADKLEAIRAVREHNNFELYGKYYEAELTRRNAIKAETRTAAEVSEAPQVPIVSETQKPQISAESEAFRFSDTLDVERLKESVFFDEKLLNVLMLIRNFSDYESQQKIKVKKDVRYGYSEYVNNKVFVFDIDEACELRLNDEFKMNYINYCHQVFNALETHYDEKYNVLKKSLSLSISDFDLKSVLTHDEIHREVLEQIIEPIKRFSLRQKNEVFSAQLDSIKSKESLIKSVFDQVQQYKSSHKKEAQAVEPSKPKMESSNRFEL